MDVSTRLTTGDLVLDTDSREALLRGVSLKLTRLEFDVLVHLVRHRGRAVPRQELLDEVWGAGYSPESNVVDVVVGSLRRKLGDDPRRPRYFVTVPGVGYRMPSEPGAWRRPRRLAWLAAVLAGGCVVGGLTAGLLLALGGFGSGKGQPDGRALVGATEGAEITIVTEAKSTRSATVAGDCRTEDMQILGGESAGTISGDLTGTVETVSSGTLFSTAGCLAGAAKGEMVLVDASGDRLELVTDSIFSSVRMEPPPAPSAVESSDVLTVVGGTGKFVNARGYGTCQTTALFEYDISSRSLQSASRSRCRLRLAEAGAHPSYVALNVRLVANPTHVGLVGAPDPSRAAATYALAIYSNEGQRDLRDLSLTLLPVEGVTMHVTARMGDGDPDPPLRTWRLADLRAGERQVFDFSVQFESADRREVPLVVRVSSKDMDEPVDSQPAIVEVE